MWNSRIGLNNFLFVQRLAFQAVGIDVTSLERTFKQPLLFGYLCIVYGLLLYATIHYYCTTTYDDMDELTFDFLPAIQYLTIIAKVITFLYKRKKVVKLVQRIQLMTKQANSEERRLIDTANNIDKKLCGSYYILVMISLFIMGIVPLAISFVVYLKYGYLRWLVPLKFSTPWDGSQPMYFIITALWLLSGIYFCGQSTSAMDTLFAGLVHSIVAQFRLLECKFRNAALETDVEKFKTAIFACIEHHQDVIDLVNDLNDIYKTIIFVKFLLNSMPICLLPYQLGSGVALEFLLFILVYLFVILFQFMIYCYGGQRIQDESTIIAFYIYDEFHWERLAVNVRKLLLLSILRAQKCCTLSGYIFVADWKLFEWVVKTAYSMVALLRSMKVDDGV